MDFLLKKKLNNSFYKTYKKIYDDDFKEKLDEDIFNEYIIEFVKSGLKKDEIIKLLRNTVEGEETNFTKFVNKNNVINDTNTPKDIICLILFGIIVTIMIFNLLI